MYVVVIRNKQCNLALIFLHFFFGAELQHLLDVTFHIPQYCTYYISTRQAIFYSMTRLNGNSKAN